MGLGEGNHLMRGIVMKIPLAICCVALVVRPISEVLIYVDAKEGNFERASCEVFIFFFIPENA